MFLPPTGERIIESSFDISHRKGIFAYCKTASFILHRADAPLIKIEPALQRCWDEKWDKGNPFSGYEVRELNMKHLGLLSLDERSDGLHVLLHSALSTKVVAFIVFEWLADLEARGYVIPEMIHCPGFEPTPLSLVRLVRAVADASDAASDRTFKRAFAQTPSRQG